MNYIRWLGLHTTRVSHGSAAALDYARKKMQRRKKRWNRRDRNSIKRMKKLKVYPKKREGTLESF